MNLSLIRKNILEKINIKNNHSLLRVTTGVSIIIILSKLLGFFRETLIADFYGATAETDAFFFAQNMPAMIFPSVGNSISTAFISLYTAKLAQGTEAEADRHASRMMLAAILLGIGLSILGTVFSPLLVPLFAPGFTGEQLSLAIVLSQLTMWVFALSMLCCMLSAILNSKKHFLGSQAAGLFYSGTIIVIMLLLGRGQRMETLILMEFGGVFMQIAALALCCKGCFHPSLQVIPFHQDAVRLLRLSLPILLGNAAYQINTIVDQALGSLLPNGSLSALSYSRTLTQFVISICITSLSTVLYPTLTANAAKGEMERYGRHLTQTMSILCWLLIPVSFITLLCAQDIVTAVYARGSFNQTAISYTGVALAGYALMFIGTGIREILTRAFYALQDTRTPMINTLLSIGCNAVFSVLLVQYLGLTGITLSTTLSCSIAACLLLRDVSKKLPHVSLAGFFSQLWRQLLAGIVMCAALLVFRRIVEPVPFALLRFLLNALLGFAVYMLLSLLLGCVKIPHRN